VLAEKKLTAAEKKKKEEIVLALKRDNPNMPKDQMYAIATAQAKKVAESKMLEKKRLLLTDEELEEGSPEFNYAMAKATVEEPEKNFTTIGGKKVRKTMDIKTARKIVKEVESEVEESQQDFNFKARITPRGETFEIGGDVFVKEMVDPPKHRYVHIVEKHLNLTEQFILGSVPGEKSAADKVDNQDYNYDHVTYLSRSTREVKAKNNFKLLTDLRNSSFATTEDGYGVIGKNFKGNAPNNVTFPIVVSSKVFSSLENINGRGNWAPVFAIPPKGDRSKGNFHEGNSVIFKWQGVDKLSEAKDLTLQLIDNGFHKIKWADNFKNLGFFIMAEHTGGFGRTLYLSATKKTIDQGYQYNPAWQLHKAYFDKGHQLFDRSSVFSSRGANEDYNFSRSSTNTKKVNSLGAFETTALPSSQADYDIYKNMSFTAGPGSAGSGSSIDVDDVIYLSSNLDRLMSDPRQHNIVSGTGRGFGSTGPINIYQLIQVQDSVSGRLKPYSTSSEEEKPKEREQQTLGLGLGSLPSQDTQTSVAAPTYSAPQSTSTQTYVDNEPMQGYDDPSQVAAGATSGGTVDPRISLIDEIKSIASSNQINISSFEYRRLESLSYDELINLQTKINLEVRKKSQSGAGATQAAETVLLSTIVGNFIRNQWRQLTNKWQGQVDNASQTALQNATDQINQALQNPNSPIRKALKDLQGASTTVLTISAMVAAGYGAWWFIRRLLRDRNNRRLSKYMYGDRDARREMEYIMRSSGLRDVPRGDLMRMIPEMERYELSMPQQRRLYDL